MVILDVEGKMLDKRGTCYPKKALLEIHRSIKLYIRLSYLQYCIVSKSRIFWIFVFCSFRVILDFKVVFARSFFEEKSLYNQNVSENNVLQNLKIFSSQVTNLRMSFRWMSKKVKMSKSQRSCHNNQNLFIGTS